MGKSYDNEIIETETSLAIERLFIAPSTVEWPASGKVDCNSPPSGFIDVGAVVEDTPSVKVTKEKFQLILGLPKALQYEQIIGVTGEFAATVYAKSNDIVAQALGVDKVEISTIGDRVPLGGTKLKKYALLGVADFVDGTQVVHFFPKVSAKPEFTEELRPDDAGKVMMGFDAYSHISTIHGGERVVGERLYFY